MHYDKDFALECRIARFHNIYGPYGTWKGGREKAPAAFCRKARCRAGLQPVCTWGKWMPRRALSCAWCIRSAQGQASSVALQLAGPVRGCRSAATVASASWAAVDGPACAAGAHQPCGHRDVG